MIIIELGTGALEKDDYSTPNEGEARKLGALLKRKKEV